MKMHLHSQFILEPMGHSEEPKKFTLVVAIRKDVTVLAQLVALIQQIARQLLLTKESLKQNISLRCKE